MGKRIAVVGSGISGLGAAWALHKEHDLTVYEAADRVGGHSNTVDVPTEGGSVAVDAGFIVYNEVTYPNLTRLFSTLGVPTEESDMSFAFSLDGEFEYGASAGGILARPSNLRRRRFTRTLLDINRFRRLGTRIRALPDESIEQVLVRYGFSKGFLDDYLFPMTGAIWSAGRNDIGSFPAASMLDFLTNHGLIEIIGRPRWRTVSGGSRNYVRQLKRPFADRIRLRTPVHRVIRDPDRIQIETSRGVDWFDHVILASHSDQSLGILGENATESERAYLSAIRYQPNEAVLHSDPALMPASQKVWSSWNALTRTDDRDSPVASVTYWMNRLQNLQGSPPLFVSLNPVAQPQDRLVHARFLYSHPQFDAAALVAQRGFARIQGHNNTWFAGAYLGYGFHEDGLQSGFNVAAALGSPVPWEGTFEPVSSALRADRALAVA